MIAVVPLFVTRMVAVKPAFHSLLRMYWHLLAVAALLEVLDATELDLALELAEETTELLDLTELTDDTTELLDLALESDDDATELTATLLELPTIP